MSFPDEIRRHEAATLSVHQFVKLVQAAIDKVRHGWRAAPRHEHDASDTLEAEMDRKVTAAIEKGRVEAGV